MAGTPFVDVAITVIVQIIIAALGGIVSSGLLADTRGIPARSLADPFVFAQIVAKATIVAHPIAVMIFAITFFWDWALLLFACGRPLAIDTFLCPFLAFADLRATSSVIAVHTIAAIVHIAIAVVV